MGLMELLDFLRARLDEDERIARAAVDEHAPRAAAMLSDRELELSEEDPASWQAGTQEDPAPGGYRYHRSVWAAGGWSRVAELQDDADEDTAEHIARHDPARVLREVAAKRALIKKIAGHIDDLGRAVYAEYGGDMHKHAANDLLSLLSLPYSDHPDYDEAWKP